MSINRFEIKYDTLEFIMSQLAENVFKLKCNYGTEQLKILMPNWIRSVFDAYSREKITAITFNSFYGIEIQSHYKNEIVVFYKDYSIDNENCYLTITIDHPKAYKPERSLPIYPK